MFTALFVGTGVVLFWRGVWGIADLLIFPSNDIMSYIASVVIGLLILYFTHYLTKELI